MAELDDASPQSVATRDGTGGIESPDPSALVRSCGPMVRPPPRDDRAMRAILDWFRTGQGV